MTSELPYLNDDNLNDAAAIDERDQFMLEHCYQKKKYKRNQQIILDPHANTVIYVHKGQLKVFVNNEQGVEKLLYYIAEGNSCLGNYNPNKDVFLTMVAASDCEVYLLDAKSVFEDVIFKHHSLDMLIDSMQNRICAMADNLLDLANCSNKGKIGKFIYSLAVQSNNTIDGKIFIGILPPREDIALFIGTHKVNVAKVLSQLEKEGLVSKYQKGLLVHDMAALKQMIAEEYRA